MNWIALVLFVACGSGPDDSGDKEELRCEYTGCDSRCVEEDESRQWEACADTATVVELCYDEGYQACEAQDDNTCGWTMVDQAGWDECVGSR